MVAACAQPFDPRAITRPDPALLRYYLTVSAFSLVLFPIVFVPLYLRYRSLRYDFQDEGIAMRWGVFFQREVHLTYRRIQDIHVSRGIVQRWMGLATIGIQTAAGSATPVMNVEGVLEAEALRDFLYTKMRGAQDQSVTGTEGTSSAVSPEAAVNDETLTLLHEIRDTLRQLLVKKSS